MPRYERTLSVPHPFPYQGSKRKLARSVIPHLRLGQGTTLVEPFAGSAAVSLRAAIFYPGIQFLLNDTNGPLVDLWRAIVSNPENLADDYERLWDGQQTDPNGFYMDVRARFNTTYQPSDFLYLLNRAIKGSIRYNQAGKFNQSPDRRRLGATPSTVRRRLTTASQALTGRVVFSCSDYQELLDRYTPGQVWYLDPPYEGLNKRNPRYTSMVDRTHLEQFIRVLVDERIPFAMSYDGQTGKKTYGTPMPSALGLQRLTIEAGPSTTATLLSRQETTAETLYLSAALLA